MEDTSAAVCLPGVLGLYGNPAPQVRRTPFGHLVHLLVAVLPGTLIGRLAADGAKIPELGRFPKDQLPRPLLGPNEPSTDESFGEGTDVVLSHESDPSQPRSLLSRRLR